ncbi:MAG: PTS transporter subunit EIIC [Spirochaetaceae bacterium]|jgi:PTS system sucrose-specific IIC component|nr:PTS transporter subunit EIIC [Spirochaetaceae bacterium]
MNYEQIAKEILQAAGGVKNITSFTNCMTRLRLEVADQSAVDAKAIKAVEGVLGVVPGDQLQIIFGPGHAQRLRDAFAKVSGIAASAEVDGGIRDVAGETRAKVKAKQQTSLHAAFRHIGNIFIPIIPGFIACGLITAVANVWKTLAPGVVTHPWFILFAAMGGAIGGALHLVTGYNSSKEFGGSPILGLLAGAINYLPALGGVVVPILGITLAPSYGGVLGVVFTAYIYTVIEKAVRKAVPAALDLFLVSFITVILGSVAAFIVIMPLSALLMKGITFVLIDFALRQGGIIGGFLLSSLFLPLVMLGIHQGLTPVHAQLIAEHGFTELLPILALAGAGQVGMAIAVFVKTKDKKLKGIISSALPIGFLGIGEPLIYGVSLPLFYPFITACAGAGFGGALLGFAASTGAEVGAKAMGVSGVLLLPLIDKWYWYLGGLVVSYIAGFILTWFFGFKESMLERLK